jgi:hypothetical protein
VISEPYEESIATHILLITWIRATTPCLNGGARLLRIVINTIGLQPYGASISEALLTRDLIGPVPAIRAIAQGATSDRTHVVH